LKSDTNPLAGNGAAIDAETGKIQWRYGLTQNSLSASVLATAGGVLRGRAVQLPRCRTDRYGVYG